MASDSIILLVLKKLGWKLGNHCLLHVSSLGKFGRCKPYIPPKSGAFVPPKCEDTISPKCDVFDLEILNNVWCAFFVTMVFICLGLLFICVRRGRTLRACEDSQSFSPPPTSTLPDPKDMRRSVQTLKNSSKPFRESEL